MVKKLEQIGEELWGIGFGHLLRREIGQIMQSCFFRRFLAI
jgi:hypothetical protein